MAYLREGRAVIGIDEVGRGAWAGPVVAAAVLLPPKLKLAGINDSKLISAGSRERLNRDIRRQAIAIGVGWVACEEVDSQGLSWAVQQSGLRALSELAILVAHEPASHPLAAKIILDGNHNYLRDSHDSIALVKADAQVVPVAAASVVAKVARDRYMAVLARRLGGYGFELHKGYGTRTHQQALRDLGPSPAHRRSWAPLMRLANVPSE